MDKNYNINMDNKRLMEEFTEAFGDAAVEMTFREVVKGMDSFFGLMGMTIELVNLIHKEEELKKHHRAYLHVRAEIENRADAVMEFIAGIVDELNAKLWICAPRMSVPFRSLVSMFLPLPRLKRTV